MHPACLMNLCPRLLKDSSHQDLILCRYSETAFSEFYTGVFLKDLIFFIASFPWHILLLPMYVQAGFPDDLSENPLDNVELLQDQLDCFPYLCRFQVYYICRMCLMITKFVKSNWFINELLSPEWQYESSSLYIINIVEPILHIYTVCWLLVLYSACRCNLPITD